MRPVESGSANEVDKESDASDRQHWAAFYKRRTEDALVSFIENNQRNENERNSIYQSRQNLNSLKSVSFLGGRRPGSKPQSKQTQPQRRRIREHMASIRHQRQAVGQPSARKLHQRKNTGQRQRNPERSSRLVAGTTFRIWVQRRVAHVRRHQCGGSLRRKQELEGKVC